MITLKSKYQKWLPSFWRGEKCVFCGKRQLCLTARGRVKCFKCGRQIGKHFKVNHDKILVTRNHNHINGIEGFWSYTKHKLYNYRGVSRANFALYLKEMEYRYNHRKDNILEPIMKLYFSYVSY